MLFNPQFSRKEVVSLNGEWQLFSDIEEINGKIINVPFCIESALSGIGYKGFVHNCVYKRNFDLSCIDKSKRTFIHFGAVDYECKLYINDIFVGSHIGGYTHFKFDITEFIFEGRNEIRLEVRDDVSEETPSGKQSKFLQSYGCFYTRTTGIWQSVWLEMTSINYIESFTFDSNIDDCSVAVGVQTYGEGELCIEIYYEDRLVGSGRTQCCGNCVIDVSLEEKHLWECGKGRLYDVVLRFCGDEVKSYFGLRKVEMSGYKFLLNGRSVFQRLVLDQGFYPDGIYTAPSIEDMEKDIDLGLRLGFNGARLHQKVFDPYFLYLCDKKGYLVWGEFPSWGIDYSRLDGFDNFALEWKNAVKFQYNHPSIVVWCPLNETWFFGDNDSLRDVRFVDEIYDITKKLDKTRPCIDVSGGFHGKQTDIYDYHCYDAPKEFGEYIKRFDETDVLDTPSLYAPTQEKKYTKGLPVMVSEFGGIPFNITVVLVREKDVATGAVINNEQWGYGDAENSFESFFSRYSSLINSMYSSKKICGACYTQLYDIEQEKNGFFFYDRSAKFTEKQMDMIAECNKNKAKIEEE